MTRLFMIFSALLMLAGCGSSSSTSVPTGGGGTASGIFPASGTLSFTGADTVNIGGQVVAGYAVPVAATSSSPASVVIVDSGNPLASTSNSSGDGFFMTVSDGVSNISSSPILTVNMLITTGGVEYAYICSITSPPTSSGDCGVGTVTLDIANRSVTFVGATITRFTSAGTQETITVDGTIRW